MAPEVGLEPTTPRLTAACSTIELLWNSKGRAIYWPAIAASIAFTPDGAALASWTIKRAASGLHDALDRTAATSARLTGAIVNSQPLLIIIRRVRRTAKVKQAVAILVLAMIQR